MSSYVTLSSGHLEERSGQARDVGTVCYDDIRYLETWVAMENLVDKGLVRGIGLSIFNGRQTHDVISISKHKPVVNQ